MRHYYFLFFFCLPLIGFSQNHYVGLRGGVGRTNIRATNFISNSDSKNVVGGGLTYAYQFKNPHFYAGVDLLYQAQGFTNYMFFTNDVGDIAGEGLEVNYSYNYLAVPLRFGFQTGESWYGFANVSFVPSVLLSAQVESPIISPLDMFLGYTTVSTSENVAPFDLAAGVELGGGYRWKNQLCTFVSFTYQESVTSHSAENYFSNSKLHHRLMGLSFGLRYPLVRQGA
jgi:hypothetical protein